MKQAINVKSKINPRNVLTRFIISVAMAAKVKPTALAKLMMGDTTKKYAEDLYKALDKQVSK